MRPVPVLALAAAAACHHASPTPAPAPPAPVVAAPLPALSEWPTTLAAAQRALEAGNFDEADQTLLRYGLRFAGTPEGSESDFWRAVIRADPANTAPTPRERIALFDAYLGGGPSAPHYLEAVVFRRLLETLDSSRTAITALRAATESRQRVREDEIKKLSDDLDRAMAELERIKKRLVPGKPGGGKGDEP